MCRIRLRNIRAFLVCVVAVGSISAVEGTGELKTFENKELKFTVQYPANWYIGILTNAFEVNSYPRRKTVRGVGVPKGAAGITLRPSEISPYSKGQKTLDGWMEVETARANVTGKTKFELQDRNEKLLILEVRTRFGSTPPYIDGVWWYFQVGDRMFGAALGYWEGDPKADRYLQILKQIVLSVKPVP